MLTDETAKNIGISSYYPYVRKVFDDILRALDSAFGKPYLMTNSQNTFKVSSGKRNQERKLCENAFFEIVFLEKV